MKIFELFENQTLEPIELFEHLGNLDVVDKKFVPIMKTFPKYEYVSQRVGSRMTMVNAMPQELGSKSKVDSVDVKSGADAYRQLNDNTDARAIIVNVNIEQVFAAFKVKSTKSSGAPDFIWVADLAQLLGHVTNHEQHAEAQQLLAGADVFDYGSNRFKLGSDKEFYKALTALLKVCKMGGNKAVQMYVLYTDTERASAKKARKEAREFNLRNTTARRPQSGHKEADPHQLSAKVLEAAKEAGLQDSKEIAAIFRNGNRTYDENIKLKAALHEIELYFTGNKKKNPIFGISTTEWNYMAKSALKSRLEKFKTNYATDVSTPEKMLEVLKEKGFLDKIKINGILYKVSSDSLNLSSLKSGKPDSSYIEYGLETWGENQEYEDLIDNLKEIIPAMTDDKDERRRLLKKYSPPFSIKVFMKLEKGAIVIDRIESEKWFQKIKQRK